MQTLFNNLDFYAGRPSAKNFQNKIKYRSNLKVINDYRKFWTVIYFKLQLFVIRKCLVNDYLWLLEKCNWWQMIANMINLGLTSKPHGSTEAGVEQKSWDDLICVCSGDWFISSQEFCNYTHSVYNNKCYMYILWICNVWRSHIN